MKIEYPTKEKQGELTEEEKNELAAKYFGHYNSLGFYPIGRLNTWHGGIHIEGENKEIKAIADGRIIAYRMSDDYCSVENNSETKYSNSFVLMQHNYISPKEQKFRFYSLYMHLMPKNTMEIKKMIPDIFKYHTGKVVGEECMHGLNARSGNEREAGENLGTVKTVIPVGAVVTMDPLPTEPSYEDKFVADPLSYRDEMVPILYRTPLPFDIEKKKYWVAKKRLQDAIDNHWSKAASVKKYRYTRIKYGEYSDIYIATTSGFVKKAEGNKLQIVCCAASIANIDNSAPKGVVVYDKPNNTGQGKYLRTEVKNTDLGELEKVDEQWFKIPEKEEYVNKNALEITETVNEKVIPNDVQNVDIEIKAGTTLGYSGIYAIKNRENYSAVHLEVFTDDASVKEFILNKIGDDNRNQYQIKENKPLQIGKPVNNLKRDTKIKIYKYKGNYAQIGFEDIESVVRHECLEYHEVIDGSSYYTIKKGRLADVNRSFENMLTKESDKLYLVSRVDEEGNCISEAEENTKIKEATKKGNTYIKYRKGKRKHLQNGQKYWVKAYAVPSADLLQAIKPLNSIGVNALQTEELDTTAHVFIPKQTKPLNEKFEPCWAKLTEDVKEVYDIEPDDSNTRDITIGEIIQVKRRLATSQDHNGAKWVKIKGQYFEDDVKKETEGWIKESELTVINPYNWQEFEWQLEEETGNQYIYQFDANKKEEPHDFIKSIWKLVDLPKKVKQSDGTYKEIPADKVLSQFELRRAMRNEHKINILSKLICKHQSEWDTWNNVDAFESEVKELYQQGIDQEEYSEEKQKLEQARDERITQLKEKIEKLCFWQEVKDGDIGTPKEGIPKRIFPKDSNVYHFHPIAFVEQMKRMLSGMPPWMEIALEEAKAAKFVKETLSPTTDMARKYHTYVGLPNATGSTSWCSSFVCWCLNEASQKNAKSASSQSVLWNEGKLFKRIEEPVFGCIVLLTNYVKSTGKSNSHGHVTFLYGVDNNGSLICLGGNQGDRLKFSRYYKDRVNSTFTQKGVKVEQKFNGFFLPIDYSVSNSKQPEVVDIKKLNDKLARKAVKIDGKNEKTT